jgi:hypothetical protein
MENCWAILKDVVETVYDGEDEAGEYLFMKEPNQVTYRLIKMIQEEGDEESEGSDDGL